jgi:hypothetical protein
VIAVGYQGDPGILPENLKKRELQDRSRKELHEFVFSGQFGNEASVLK